MVKVFHQLFLAGIFILSLSSQCIATEKLVLLTDKTESTLGRPVRVELYGISLSSRLSDINLAALEKNFGVVTDYSISSTTDARWPNEPVQALYLKIYPRQAGKIVIPRLSINNTNSLEKTINVLKGKTGIPRISISSAEPYERQQVLLHVKLTSPDSTARLSIKEDSEIKGFESSPLLFKRTRQKDGAYQLNIGWALTPLKEGNQVIQFPPIEYSVSGVSRKRFFLPAFIIKTRKLPKYLPPTIPVGEISIKSKLPPEMFLNKGSVYYWDIQLTGPHNNPYRLQPVLRQVKANKQFKILPVTSKRTTHVTNKSLSSMVTHSIPFKALENGSLNLPQIRLQYFDPASGTIKSMIYKTKPVFVLDLFFRSLAIIIILILIGAISWLSYRQWKKVSYSKQKYKQAIALLDKPSNRQEIRESISLLSEADYWPKNSTLTQWGNNWLNKYKTHNDFKSLIEQLSSALYSHKTNYNLDELAEKLIKLITERKKLSNRTRQHI